MSFDPAKRREIKADRLRLVVPTEPFQANREPALCLGDVVQLISGGPRCLVVDQDGDHLITISWRNLSGKVCETVLPRACVHRIEVAD